MIKVNWPRSSLHLSIVGQWRGFRQNTTIINQQKGAGGPQRKNLSGIFSGATPGYMSRLSTTIALDLHCLGTVDDHMAVLATPVALDLGAVFLNVTIFTTRVALLLFLTVTVTSQMTWFATSVTALLSWTRRLDTVFGDVATSPTVVADVLVKVTVLSVMTRFTAAVTDVTQSGRTVLTTSATASSSSLWSLFPSRASPDPVARASTLEIFLTAHGYKKIFQWAGVTLPQRFPHSAA